MASPLGAVFLWTFLLTGVSPGQTPRVNHLFPGAGEAKPGSPRELAVLEETLAAVSHSFERGSTDGLDTVLSDRRIYLSLRVRGEEPGYFGRSQVKFMFAKLFRERKTDSFSYDPREVEVSGEKNAQFRAKWKYMVLDSDEVVTEHLRFELEQIRGVWLISGIRSVPR